MRYGPKPNARDPRAIGECDRCAKVVFHNELRRQMLQTQTSAVWSGLLVCSRCLDPPNPQERIPRLRPDPVPIKNPRPVKDGATVVPPNWPPSAPLVVPPLVLVPAPAASGIGSLMPLIQMSVSILLLAAGIAATAVSGTLVPTPQSDAFSSGFSSGFS